MAVLAGKTEGRGGCLVAAGQVVEDRCLVIVDGMADGSADRKIAVVVAAMASVTNLRLPLVGKSVVSGVGTVGVALGTEGRRSVAIGTGGGIMDHLVWIIDFVGMTYVADAVKRSTCLGPVGCSRLGREDHIL